MRGVKPRSPVFGAEGLGIEGGWSSVGCPLACAFGSGHCVRECWTEFAATASRPGAAGASKRVIGRIIGQILATRVSPLGATQPVRRPRAGAHGRCWSPPQQRRRCSSSVPTWARTAANICFMLRRSTPTGAVPTPTATPPNSVGSSRHGEAPEDALERAPGDHSRADPADARQPAARSRSRARG
jgi:hypothetical protein